jgi:hypothetical protein
MKMLVKLHNAFSFVMSDAYDVADYFARQVDKLLNLFINKSKMLPKLKYWYIVIVALTIVCLIGL